MLKQRLLILLLPAALSACATDGPLSPDYQAAEKPSLSMADNANCDVNADADPAPCIKRTLYFGDPIELAADLTASVSPAFLFPSQAPALDEVRIPSALKGYVHESIGSGVGYFETFHGWTFHNGAHLEQKYQAEPNERYAAIVGWMSFTGFEGQTTAVAKALFDAMSEANQTQSEIDLPGSVLFQTIRKSPAGRFTCVHQKSSSGFEEYGCVVSKFRFDYVNTADGEEADLLCPGG